MALHIPSQTMVLPNGLTVVVSPKEKLPIATISVRFKVGSAYDPEDKAARRHDRPSARQGDDNRTATAIAEELDFLGARLDATAGGTGGTVSLSLLAKISTVVLTCSPISCKIRVLRWQSSNGRTSMLSQIQQRRVNPRQLCPKCQAAWRAPIVTPPNFRLCGDGVSNHP